MIAHYAPLSFKQRLSSDPSGVRVIIWVLLLGVAINLARKFFQYPAVTLKNTPYNPVPEDAFSGYIETPDNIRLRYARWKATAHPAKGTVLLLHGRTECIEKLFETVSDLRKRGFEVLTFDWRGQGGSSRLIQNKLAGYIDDYEDYIVDLETVFQQVALPDCKAPYYILAHSTGGLISLLAAPRFANKVRRMVLSSPLLGLENRGLPQPGIRLLSGFMSAIGLGESYLGSGSTPAESSSFAGNIYTSDPERFDRNRRLVEDFRELAVGGTTAAWVFATCQAMELVHDMDFYTGISIPSLLVLAGNEQVVSNQAIEELGARLRAGSTLTIDGAKHEILQEHDIYREQLLAAFDSFIPGSDETGP
ncbi:MAG: alpha/beta hydrolase [Rhizobiaceae bacterium]|nr:alpha/beta hydrolase [Rhizobiaceae bacterium]